jgi:TetR/AcrR family transcriptional regulator, cholesterol catabolism regulator
MQVCTNTNYKHDFIPYKLKKLFISKKFSQFCTMNSVRSNVIAKAQELFMTYGFKSVTVDDIAKASGISKKTLYEHFTDKDDIVNAVLASIDQTMNQDELAIAKKSANAIEEVIGLMWLFEAKFRAMSPNCIPDLQKYYPSCFLQWQDNRVEMEERIKRNLKRGIKENLYRKNINVEIMSFVRVEEIMFVMTNNAAMKRFSFVDLQIQMLESFLYGISSLKGHELIKTITTIQKS